jgi:hypothetical protein
LQQETAARTVAATPVKREEATERSELSTWRRSTILQVPNAWSPLIRMPIDAMDATARDIP